MPGAACVVRRVNRDELEEFVSMCAEHALHERADYDACGKAALLDRLLFGPSTRLVVWVAVAEAKLVGYVSVSSECSTWSAREFLHMDCLFVRDGCRGAGIGAALLATSLRHARKHGYAEVQWQTPAWNVDAERFYLREGACRRTTSRFLLRLSPSDAPDTVGH